jgi:hypothetical protein
MTLTHVVVLMCVMSYSLPLRFRRRVPDMALLKKDDLWQITTSMPAEEVEILDSQGKVAGSIRMRGLTGEELTAYQDSVTVTLSSGQRRGNTRKAIAKLIARCAINEDGSPYFDASDISKLDQAPARMLMPLFESAQRLCGLTDEDIREMAEDFDEIRSELSNSD